MRIREPFSLRSSLALKRLRFWPRYGRRKLTKTFCFLGFLVLAAYLWITPLVPLSWQEADLSHIVRVIADFQDFPTDGLNDATRVAILEKIFGAKEEFSVMETRNAAAIIVTKSLLKSRRKASHDYYPQFFHKLQTLESLLDEQPSVLEVARMLNIFRPILTQSEKSQLLMAFDAFTSLCDAAGVTYFLLEASLMGVRRHHGMIPWDDDIDVVVNASQWEILHAVLSSVPGFELFAPHDVQWKFYVNTSKPFPDQPFKFPYVDISFFKEDEFLVWVITRELKHDLVHRKQDIFPLLRRPFEGRLVPVPHNLPLLVDDSHDVNECITGEYNQKTNKVFFYSGKVSVPCSDLRDVYPFVDRKVKSRGIVEETLRVDRRTVHRLVFREL